MKIAVITIRFVILLITLSVGVGRIYAQTPTDNPPPLATFQQDHEQRCLKQTISEKRTYTFRELPRADEDSGAYGGKLAWYKKVFPFLKTPLEKYGVDDVRTLQKTYLIPAPLGESKRSFGIRAETEKNVVDLEQKVKLSQFSWRENGVDVGKIGTQLFCNTCWAYETLDAMQISRQLYAIRSNKILDKSELPSVRQLVSCMVPKDADYCESQRVDSAFNFMVDKGLPLGGTTKYTGKKADYICDAETFVKALTWDFVSTKPYKVAAPEEIKRAIIVYGSVISSISYDNCYELYGGGIFNEQHNRDGSHMVLIIGWDDKKNAWLVKNSAGKTWGENGFGWIKYGTNNIGQFAAFIVADPKEEERIAEKLSKK